METTTIELRKLQSKDVFAMTRIIKKIGVNEFKDCINSEEVKEMMAKKGETDYVQLGMSIFVEIAGVVISHIGDAENEIYAFISNLSGLSPKEVSELDMIVFTETIIELFQKEEFKDFIGVVSKLFK